MTDRHTADTINSDALDQLYADLARYEEVVGELNEANTGLARKAARAEAALARVRTLAALWAKRTDQLKRGAELLQAALDHDAPGAAATEATEPVRQVDADPDDPPVQCWHTEPGTPCDWDVCKQPERLAAGDYGTDPREQH
jgi:hypothetical protein